MNGSRPCFPLAALVSQEDLVLSLLLCTVDRGIGGVLVRGEKGSGKTTAARGLAEVLAPPAPFVELPLGAGEDRVVGALDLRAALGGGDYRFQPGLLAAADGGVLYVDEVNLLADHLVDVLLDAAATGENRVERDGVSQTHPSRFVLVGSMNPEEGELRPQLLDRFGLAVDVAAPGSEADRAEAVRRRLSFEADPEALRARFAASTARLARRLAACVPASLAPGTVERVVRLCAAAGSEGLRADLVICRAAAALAGWEGRGETAEQDVRRVAPLALAHRRRTPWQQPAAGRAELESLLEQTERPPGTSHRPADSGTDRRAGEPGGGDRGAGEPGGADRGAGEPGGADRGAGEPGAPGPANGPREPGPTGFGDGQTTAGHLPADQRPAGPGTGAGDGADAEPGDVAGGPAPRTQWEPPRAGDATAGGQVAGRVREATAARPPRDRDPGHRGNGSAATGRGRLVGSEPMVGADPGPLALAATVAAASARRAGDPGAAGSPLRIAEEDLRAAVRRSAPARLVVLVVDASGSMGVEGRMEAARRTVMDLLVDAYQRRDRVAVVTFRGEAADVVLRPTGSTEVARSRLQDLSTGGRTPLAAGLAAALALVEGRRAELVEPLLIVLSDGRATWAAGGRDPVRASHDAARAVARAGVPAVVVDCEQGRTRLGLARPLADAMGAYYVSPEESAAVE